MNTLEKKLQDELVSAMKNHDQVKVNAIRSIKSAIQLAKTAKDSNGELSGSDIIKIIQKQISQRNESQSLYSASGRIDLAENEKAEAEVLMEFLPKQLTEEEIEANIKKIIAETGASSVRDMGKVMPIATKSMEGAADSKIIGQITKKLLSA